MSADRYGNTKIAKIKAAYDDLRAAVRAGDNEAAQAALDRYEQWADFAFAPHTDLSQASVAAALEAAAKEHDAEIVRLEAQIIENKNYLRLVGKSERSSANDFCNTAIGHHRGSAVRLRDLITHAQHDALAAHVAAEVAKARAEDAAVSQAAQDVIAERQRQIAKEGWTPEHDDEHSDGELALVAALYAAPVQLYDKFEYDNGGMTFSDPWPETWDDGWDRREDFDSRRKLVIAGALIIAEIERLDRAIIGGQDRG